jgi:hypothetical protein
MGYEEISGDPCIRPPVLRKLPNYYVDEGGNAFIDDGKEMKFCLTKLDTVTNNFVVTQGYVPTPPETQETAMSNALDHAWKNTFTCFEKECLLQFFKNHRETNPERHSLSHSKPPKISESDSDFFFESESEYESDTESDEGTLSPLPLLNPVMIEPAPIPSFERVIVPSPEKPQPNSPTRIEPRSPIRTTRQPSNLKEPAVENTSQPKSPTRIEPNSPIRTTRQPSNLKESAVENKSQPPPLTSIKKEDVDTLGEKHTKNERYAFLLQKDMNEERMTTQERKEFENLKRGYALEIDEERKRRQILERREREKKRAKLGF